MDAQSKTVTKEKLESYLEMAIRTSSVNADPFKDDVTCSLNTWGLIEQLFAIRNIKGALGNNAYGVQAPNGEKKGEKDFSMKTLKVFEAFVIEYNVKWPLTLILSHKSIIKYQLIFRHLLSCKYVERNLEKAWL
jgi:gamma-tubulin complex component 2